MQHAITRNEIAAAYMVAGLTLCLGVYFGLKVEGDIGTTLVREFYLFAVCVVLKFTFAWGRIRGFPARGKNGSLDFSNVVRNLVMSVIVWAALCLLMAPFLLLAFKMTR